ncbi:MAG: hypothetical protein ACTSR2_09010 [Candidatus Hodarchaeales archaeon]
MVNRFQEIIHFLSTPTILTPNGGETLNGTVNIQWIASNDSFGHSITYTVSYSPDGGTSWVILVSGLITTHYDWDTNIVENGVNYLIQVNASCSEGLWEQDTSDSIFTIYNPEIHNLSIPTILTPNGGETLNGTVYIQWMASNDSLGHTVTYTVSYSPDGGTSWVILVSGLTTTHYDWDTNIVENGVNYLIQVNASCSEGLWELDTSDETFTIHNEVPTTSTSNIVTNSTSVPTSTSDTSPSIQSITSSWTLQSFVLTFLMIVLLTRIRRKLE